MPLENLSPDILVAGAGPNGLIMAIALAHQNPDMKIALLEKSSSPESKFDRPAIQTTGRAFSLSAASVNLFKVLDIWKNLVQNAEPVKEVSITDSALEEALRPVLLQFDNTHDRDEPAAFIIAETVLKKVLLKTIASHENISPVYNMSIASVEEEQGKAHVTCSDGQKVSVELVIACDGRFSSLRQQAGIKTVAWPSRQWGVVASVKHEKPHAHTAVQYFLPAGPLAFLPLPENRLSIVWTETRQMASYLEKCPAEDFILELQQRTGDQYGDMELVSLREIYPLEMQLARSYTAPGLVLVGDAAHAMHWIAGQGLNFGLKDVAALTEILTENWRHGLPLGSALVTEQYESWRRFDANTFTLSMQMLNSLFGVDLTPVRFVRSLGMQVLDHVPMVKNLLVREAAGETGKLPKLLKGQPV